MAFYIFVALLNVQTYYVLVSLLYYATMSILDPNIRLRSTY